MTAPDAEKGRLLAIDDNADSAELIARIAARCGYEARSIANCRKLAEILKEWQPHVLTLDLCMPEEDGIGILSVLTESGFTGSLIIISGQEDWLRKAAGRLASARGLHVADDFPKPIDIKSLQSRLTGLRDPACELTAPANGPRLAVGGAS